MPVAILLVWRARGEITAWNYGQHGGATAYTPGSDIPSASLGGVAPGGGMG
jgi:hypothetical protein